MLLFPQHRITILGTLCVTLPALHRGRAAPGLMKMAVFTLSFVVPSFFRCLRTAEGRWAGRKKGKVNMKPQSIISALIKAEFASALYIKALCNVFPERGRGRARFLKRKEGTLKVTKLKHRK